VNSAKRRTATSAKTATQNRRRPSQSNSGSASDSDRSQHSHGHSRISHTSQPRRSTITRSPTAKVQSPTATPSLSAQPAPHGASASEPASQSVRRTGSVGPSRKSSPSPSSSSSSDHSHHSIPRSKSQNQSKPAHTSGIGRKVAATLQLFKETDPIAEGSHHLKSRASLASVKNGASIESKEAGEEVEDTLFVKRSAWPDRESAAAKRAASGTAIDRTRTRESAREAVSESREKRRSVVDEAFNDLLEWRTEIARGRALERENVPEVTSPESMTSTPGWSSSWKGKSRDTLRVSSPMSTLEQGAPLLTPHPPTTSTTPTPEFVGHDGPLSPWLAPELPPTPVSPKGLSPSGTYEHRRYDSQQHSTYSASDWDSQSNASSVLGSLTTVSGTASDADVAGSHTPSHSRPLSPSSPRTEKEVELDREDEDEIFGLEDLELRDGKLPPVPLRPYKNQVGGHSALFKFTSRAVCKVCASSDGQTVPHG
jgi:inositol-hexakisphosphate kinase